MTDAVNQAVGTTPAAQETPPAKHAYAHLAEHPAPGNEEVDEGDDDTTGQQGEPGAKKAAKPIQPRINELVRKQREAEREAAYWRGVAQGKTPASSPAPSAAPAPAATPKPVKENFQTYDEYVEAVSDWKADLKVKAALADVNATIEARESRQSDAQVKANRAKNWQERSAATREVLPDFDEVLSAADGAKIENHTAELLEDSPHGPAIAYKLAKDPELLDKLNKMSPTAAAKEFGKMESVFDGHSNNAASPTPSPHATKAPKPPSGIQQRSSTSKDVTKMSMDEYIAHRKSLGMR